jgi:hypothetical protein
MGYTKPHFLHTCPSPSTVHTLFPRHHTVYFAFHYFPGTVSVMSVLFLLCSHCTTSLYRKFHAKAVPWLRRLVTGLSQRRLRFAPWSIHVGFVEKVALRQVSLRVPRFSPVSVIPPGLYTRISSGGWAIGPFVAAVQRHILTPSTWITTTTTTARLFTQRRKRIKCEMTK